MRLSTPRMGALTSHHSTDELRIVTVAWPPHPMSMAAGGRAANLIKPTTRELSFGYRKQRLRSFADPELEKYGIAATLQRNALVALAYEIESRYEQDRILLVQTEIPTVAPTLE